MAKGGDGRELDRHDNRQNQSDGRTKNGEKVGGIASDTLRSFVDRVERLDDERRGIGEDIKEVLKEAKDAGFNPKVIRFIVAERRKDANAVERFNREAELYRRVLSDASPEEREEETL